MDSLDRDVLLRVLALCSCRDVLALACTCRELSTTLQDDDVWRQLAEQKWGPAVRRLASVQPGGWAAWVKHRLSASSPPRSPLDLGQEHYTDCPFQHITACLLCSRTTGGPTVREATRLFLALYPSPSDVLAAPESSMREVMHPLGLQDTRLAGVRGLAHDFLAMDWQDPSEFKHCGKFVSDSWRIFCRAHRSLAGIEDKNLRRYLSWVLSESVEDKEAEEKQRQRAGASRKRKAEPKAEAGMLRSGRRRGDSAAGTGSTRPAGHVPRAAVGGERRLTRAAAAGAEAKPPDGANARQRCG